MTNFANLSKIFEKNFGLIFLVISLLVAGCMVFNYDSNLGSTLSKMAGGRASPSQYGNPMMGMPESNNNEQRQLWSNFTPEVNNQIQQGATGVSTNPPKAANPTGMNGGPASAAGIQTVTQGLPPSCSRQPVTNPGDLLPKDDNTDFGQLNPSGAGELANVNLLKAGYHAGIDTVGSTLRNSNLQTRSEPPNPSTTVSPWNNSTIEPDLMRVPLEIGCGPQ